MRDSLLELKQLRVTTVKQVNRPRIASPDRELSLYSTTRNPAINDFFQHR